MHYWDIFSIFFNMTVCCVFFIRIASYHFNIKKKLTLNYSKSAAMGFSKEIKKEFEIAVVNEPSVFEPLKVYCIMKEWNSTLLYDKTTNPGIARSISRFSGLSDETLNRGPASV